jgi:hypothetical protein
MLKKFNELKAGQKAFLLKEFKNAAFPKSQPRRRELIAIND